MDIDNIKAQMRKGVLEYCILSILKNGDAYASEIIERLKKSQLIVVEGTLYPLLTRQKNEGLLHYRWEESLQGPPRKYYSLSDEGVRTLEELDKSWLSLVDSVKSIIESNNNQSNI